ncbi:unnamed protein product [Sphenostylis stenocarpa]|uniref:Uncharacterized protein n=1 Tax=Sphenostylis stenocarpa TaxID=92480 RepID=A0AA86VZ27_9FABA|nr:unnamed protein product [Sphenostylis stenocarpa]
MQAVKKIQNPWTSGVKWRVVGISSKRPSGGEKLKTMCDEGSGRQGMVQNEKQERGEKGNKNSAFTLFLTQWVMFGALSIAITTSVSGVVAVNFSCDEVYND